MFVCTELSVFTAFTRDWTRMIKFVIDSTYYIGAYFLSTAFFVSSSNNALDSPQAIGFIVVSRNTREGILNNQGVR